MRIIEGHRRVTLVFTLIEAEIAIILIVEVFKIHRQRDVTSKARQGIINNLLQHLVVPHKGTRALAFFKVGIGTEVLTQEIKVKFCNSSKWPPINNSLVAEVVNSLTRLNQSTDDSSDVAVTMPQLLLSSTLLSYSSSLVR